MILDMKQQELVGIGIAPRGYALGINAVVVEIGAVRGLLGVQPLWMHEIDFPNDLVTRLHSQTRIGAQQPELSALDCEIASYYAEAVEDLLLGARIGERNIRYAAIQGIAASSRGDRAGENFPAQIEIVSARPTVVTDFPTKDMQSGGCGAPIGCMADCQMFGDNDLGTLVISLGSLASITVVPRLGSKSRPIGFVTGPGIALNEILEASDLAREQDSVGMSPVVMAEPREALLVRLLRHPFLEIQPPKTVGIDSFSAQFLDTVLAWPEAKDVEFEELRATFYAFTAWSIAEGLRNFLPADLEFDRVIVGGTGAGKAELMIRLEQVLPDLPILNYEMFGLPGGAQDAIAAAVLGAATLAGIPNNIPSCTGAREPAVMGSIAIGDDYDVLIHEATILRNSWLGNRA